MGKEERKAGKEERKEEDVRQAGCRAGHTHTTRGSHAAGARHREQALGARARQPHARRRPWATGRPAGSPRGWPRLLPSLPLPLGEHQPGWRGTFRGGHRPPHPPP